MFSAFWYFNLYLIRFCTFNKMSLGSRSGAKILYAFNINGFTGRNDTEMNKKEDDDKDVAYVLKSRLE